MDKMSCSEMPLDDLITYASITTEDILLGGARPYFEMLSSKGYGNSYKELDNYFRNHFRICDGCYSEFRGYVEMQRYLHSDECAAGYFGLDEDKTKDLMKWREYRKRFLLEHAEMDEEATKLSEYILDKYMCPQQIGLDESYETHIKGCRFCTEMDALTGVVGRLLKDARKNV